MIAIHCAMIQEADLIIKKYNLKLIDQLVNIKVYKNNDLLLVVSGIGKIQTSIALTYILNKWTFEKIINIWIAWNTWKIKSSKIWDIFLPTTFWQHDIYLPFEWEHLNYAKSSIKINLNLDIEKDKFNFNIFENAICVTGDQFIDNDEKIKQLISKYNADIVEMEAFAFVSVLREFNLLDRAIVIKSVSDSADKNAILDHQINLEKAMKNWIMFLDYLINNNGFKKVY